MHRNLGDMTEKPSESRCSQMSQWNCVGTYPPAEGKTNLIKGHLLKPSHKSYGTMPHCQAAPHIFPLITLSCLWLGEVPGVTEKTMLNDLILVKSITKSRAPRSPRLTVRICATQCEPSSTCCGLNWRGQELHPTSTCLFMPLTPGSNGITKSC